MADIKVEDLNEIKEELETLKDNDVIFAYDNDEEAKYAILPIELYDRLEQYRSAIEDKTENEDNMKIISNFVNELSYDEYETIKKQLMDGFEKVFKPKPEKLN